MCQTKKILLIVDNDEDWLALLERFLEAQGYGVHITQDYAGAVKEAERVLPHCAIVDIKLGSESGLSVCEYIKTSPALKKVPVIMMSGLDAVPEGSGCDAFVCKADGMERLLSVVEKVLSGR